MNLLLITQDFPPAVGGIQTYAAALACRFARFSNDFAVVAPSRRGDRDADGRLPFPVYRIATPTNWLPVSGIPVVMRVATKMEADALFHAQWQTVLCAKPLPRQRVFVGVHGRELLVEPYTGRSPMTRPFRNLRDALLRRVDAFFPVSRYTAGLLEDIGVPDRKITVVGNGTDPMQFSPCNTDRLKKELGLTGQKVLFTVSRLIERKGADTTLRALPYVLASHEKTVFLIGGEGPYRKALERTACSVGAANHVRFLGRIEPDQLCEYYNLCDVFVMPARERVPEVEGYGLVFLEANACGKPVIGARTGGIPDAIEDGETGLLVKPDDPVELAAAIVKLLDDDTLAKSLGASGRERVNRVANWDAVARRMYRRMEEETGRGV